MNNIPISELQNMKITKSWLAALNAIYYHHNILFDINSTEQIPTQNGKILIIANYEIQALHNSRN